MKIPFCKPSIGKKEIKAVERILRSGWLAAGKETEAFEKEFANYTGIRYAIFTNSGTAALKMAYKYAKEEFGKKTACCPKNTFCATYSAAVEMGLDVSVNSGFRVNIHYGGVKDTSPCLIEDSAHRIEKNDPLVGMMRCYSFYVTKNMTTGAGGMFVTNDEEIYDKARLYWRDGLSTSSHERLTGTYDYKVEAMAGGYDGNDIAAAIGRVQLKKLPEFTKRRNEIVKMYNDAFGRGWKGNHLYPYFVNSVEEVKPLRRYLKDKGIATGYHYPDTGWLGVSLPLYPKLTNKEVNYIICSVL